MEEVEVENKDEQLTNKTNELETCKRELEKSNNQFTSEFQKKNFFWLFYSHDLATFVLWFLQKKYLFFNYLPSTKLFSAKHFRIQEFINLLNLSPLI